jgi:hypothetical protein
VDRFPRQEYFSCQANPTYLDDELSWSWNSLRRARKSGMVIQNAIGGMEYERKLDPSSLLYSVLPSLYAWEQASCIYELAALA